MDGKARALNAAGYIVCSVSHRCEGGAWQDGGQRAISMVEIEERTGRVPEVGESVDGPACADGVEIVYTRIM